jgi:hypothetical protein
MKKFYFLIAVLLISSLLTEVNGQPLFSGAEKFDKSSLGYDYGLGITSDISGNIYTIGRFSGQTDFDPSAASFILTANNDDIFITKSDSVGNFIWAKKIGGPFVDEGTSVVTDKLQNVYFTGHFCDSVDFDPGPGVRKLYAPFLGGFICKLHSDGSFAWAHRLGLTANATSFGICIDDEASLYVAGTFDGTAPVDFDPGPESCYLTYTAEEHAFICKFDSAGNFIWGKRTGGAAMSISLDGNKNVYVAGQFTGTSDFDPGLGSFYLTSVGNDNGGDGFVCKLDSNGIFQWADAFTASSSFNTAVCRSISSAPNGDIVVAGELVGMVDFDPGTPTNYQTSTGDIDAFICKINSNGQFRWTKVIGDDKVAECFAAKFGNHYKISFTGQFMDTAYFGASNTYPLFTPASTWNAFLVQCDSSGNFLCAGSFYGGKSYGLALNEDHAGRILITGSFSDSTDFDLGVGSFLIHTTQYNTTFVAKYEDCSSALSITEEMPRSNFSIAPNPNAGYFTLSNLPDESKLEIFDAFGNLLQTNLIGVDSFNVDFSDKPKGIYLLMLRTDRGVLTRKIIIQ